MEQLELDESEDSLDDELDEYVLQVLELSESVKFIGDSSNLQFLSSPLRRSPPRLSSPRLSSPRLSSLSLSL